MAWDPGSAHHRSLCTARLREVFDIPHEWLLCWVFSQGWVCVEGVLPQNCAHTSSVLLTTQAGHPSSKRAGLWGEPSCRGPSPSDKLVKEGGAQVPLEGAGSATAWGDH